MILSNKHTHHNTMIHNTLAELVLKARKFESHYDYEKDNALQRMFWYILDYDSKVIVYRILIN